MSRPQIDLKEMLVNALKGHDWYYARSDDYRVWNRGKQASVHLSSLMEQYTAEVGARAAAELWNKHCPEGFRRQVPEE